MRKEHGMGEKVRYRIGKPTLIKEVRVSGIIGLVLLVRNSFYIRMKVVALMSKASIMLMGHPKKLCILICKGKWVE